MSEGRDERREGNQRERMVTAVDLAKTIVDATAKLLEIVDKLELDADVEEKMKQALIQMQRKAIDYLYSIASRRRYGSNRSGGGKTWQRRKWRL